MPAQQPPIDDPTPADVTALASSLAGTLLSPADEAYGAARRVWNGMIDRYPALIAQCQSVDDVVAALRFARGRGLDVAVRGGGHNVAGFGTCDNGLVIDLAGLRGVALDEDGRTATVGGGNTWGTFDTATAGAGLHTTGGLVSTTGVAGFTLGGGLGWLMRRHGLACDNLVAAELVTAEGDVVRTSETEEPELLWGLRGGGGNFGVVTEMTFRVHSVRSVVGGLLLYPGDRAREVLHAFAEACGTAPDELTLLAALITAPPAPFVPDALHGRPAVAVAGCHLGGEGAASADLGPLRALGPAVDLIGPMPYPALQSMQDPTAPAGQRHYWKSGYLNTLEPRLLDALLDASARMPVPFAQLHLHQMGGAVARVAPGDTAFAHRDAAFTLNILGTWEEPGGDAAGVDWAREAFASIVRWTSGAYVNFMSSEGEARVRDAYDAASLGRLGALKRRLDPGNVFRLNQNIRP